MAHQNVGSLQRVLGPLGISLLTLSVLSPGASVLVTGADVVHSAGSGAALAFLIGGLVTLVFTFAQAELGSAFPLAGGDYATVGNTLGPLGGALLFGCNLANAPLFIAVTSFGVGQYVHALWPALPIVPVAVAGIACGAALALLNIRTGALVTGVFLVVELGALAILAWLGLDAPAQPLASAFAAPVTFSGGAAVPVRLGTMAIAIAAGSWATSGAGQAIYFSEEMHDPVSVGRLVMGIAILTVAIEFIAVLGVVLGTGNRAVVFGGDAPFGAFLAERASPWVARAITLGIVAALFNAVVAGITCYSRFLFSSGRDRVWGHGLNRALVHLHPRFGSPWAATLVLAGATAACLMLGLTLLVMLCSGLGIANFVLINLGGLAGRRKGLTGGAGRYRAPFTPLPQILSLVFAAALAIMAWRDPVTGRPGVMFVGAVLVVSALYYRLVLARRAGGWRLFAPS